MSRPMSVVLYHRFSRKSSLSYNFYCCFQVNYLFLTTAGLEKCIKLYYIEEIILQKEYTGMLKIITGIIIALAAVILFLCYRGISPWPPLDVSFRESKIPFSSSLVLVLKNTSSQAELNGNVEVYSSGSVKAVFSRQVSIDPGDTYEIGSLEGWSFSKGETVVIDMTGYILPLRKTVP